MPSSCSPSSQLLSPSSETSATAQHRQADRGDLERVEDERHRRPSANESSTSAGATISAICALLPTLISSASVISSLARGRDRAVVLGGVADERDDDDAGEELGHAERRRAPAASAADQDFGLDRGEAPSRRASRVSAAADAQRGPCSWPGLARSGSRCDRNAKTRPAA